MSVSDFVSTTLPLLEMEKNAEVAQVMHCTVSMAGLASLCCHPVPHGFTLTYSCNCVGSICRMYKWSPPDMFTLGQQTPTVYP